MLAVCKWFAKILYNMYTYLEGGYKGALGYSKRVKYRVNGVSCTKLKLIFAGAGQRRQDYQGRGHVQSG